MSSYAADKKEAEANAITIDAQTTSGDDSRDNSNGDVQKLEREPRSIRKHWQAFFYHTMPDNAHLHKKYNDHDKKANHHAVPDAKPQLVVSTDILSIAEMYNRVRDAGTHKVIKPLSQTLLHSILAGFYVGFGATLALFAGGGLGTIRIDYPAISRLFYAATFPVALILIIMLGAELFTGDCILDTVALLEGDVSWWRYFLSLLLSWFGNLVGAMIITQLIHKSHIMTDGFEVYIRQVAHKKVHVLTWEQVYVRGILGNWLVDLAVIMAASATSYAGKSIACFVPIFCFAFLQFEHCIANMIMITLGKLAGEPVTVRHIVANNLIPSTLGNFTGGAVFVGLPYFLLYGRVADKLNRWTTF